jgi:glycosyltransferase involved in cell wall biosynthesis
VISVFPQLAIMLAIRKIFSRRKFHLIAWCFNVGAKPSKAKTFISKILLKQVDVFVVHSRGEMESLHSWFGIPRDKVRFVHLQRAPIEILSGENSSDPFIVAMGSANRDYSTLISAVREINIKCKIVASPRSIDSKNLPSNVELINGLTSSECHLLAQQARINVIPLADVETASGQVTIVEAMRMGRPVVATEGVGSVDYIQNGFDGLLVPPQDASALKFQIERLWNSEALRMHLSQNSMATANSRFSDEVAAQELIRIMDEFVTSN